MRKLLCIWLLAGILLLALSGCGGGGGTQLMIRNNSHNDFADATWNGETIGAVLHNSSVTVNISPGTAQLLIEIWPFWYATDAFITVNEGEHVLFIVNDDTPMHQLL